MSPPGTANGAGRTAELGRSSDGYFFLCFLLAGGFSSPLLP
jgi:hypothetical protein